MDIVVTEEMFRQVVIHIMVYLFFVIFSFYMWIEMKERLNALQRQKAKDAQHDLERRMYPHRRQVLMNLMDTTEEK